MSHFHIYVDKENSSQLGVLQTPQAPGVRTGPGFLNNIFVFWTVGKTFNGGLNAQSALRKALGDVKNTPAYNVDAGRPEVKPHLKKEQPQCRPTSLAKSFSSCSKQLEVVKEQDTKMEVKASEVSEEVECEPMEHMVPYDEEHEDDFEDLFPHAERPSTYLDEILGSRLPIFGVSPPQSSANTSSDSIEEFYRDESLEIDEITDSENLFLSLGPLSDLREGNDLFDKLNV